MKTLYLDCGMGAAGDMLTAALLELVPDPIAVLKELNAAGIPGVEYVMKPAVKCGITGRRVSVYVNGSMEEEAKHSESSGARSPERERGGLRLFGRGSNGGHDHSDRHDHSGEHHTHDHNDGHEHGYGEGKRRHSHRKMRDVEQIIRSLRLPEKVKTDALTVYRLIAEAESAAHGMPVEEIHFHEVGSRDAIADVTAVCLLMNQLAPEQVIASPVHVGSGQVRTAHGILPVPAPATAWLLRGVPIYGGNIQGELCTPTGAALLRRFVQRFGDMPAMEVSAVGYGMGKKDFEQANCVRALLGETTRETAAGEAKAEKTETLPREAVQKTGEQVLELSCNVDDMTAEEIGFAMEQLFAGGAKEVYTIPIGMKKSRPGVLLRTLCREEDRETMLRLLFAHTTTLGVRENLLRRYTLDRAEETLETPYGPVRRKRSSGYGVERVKYEYEDMARIAKEREISLAEVRELLDKT